MSDGASPLQRAVRKAIEASGQTRDALDAELRKRFKTSGKPLWDIDRGKSKRPAADRLRVIEGVLGVKPGTLEQLVYPRSAPPVDSDVQPTQSVDAGETAQVMRMDLSYAMGAGTNIDEHYIEGEPVTFDLSFLRRLTPTIPDMLRIVNGIGDSMEPTIHDSEELILDLGQRVLNLQDRIWALSLFGVGAVKRLQAAGPGTVLVISDNPDVPNREVSTDDIVIVGRIVGSVKRH